MASLLHLCVRPEQDAAAAEHASFRRALGVSELDRLDLLDENLDPVSLARYDGVVVGGSPFNTTTPEQSAQQQRVESDLRAVARAAIDGTIAAFFTCYGIGVVTRMLGGHVDTDHPESASAATITLTADAADDPLFGAAPASFSVLTGHKEGSIQAPPGAVLLASGEACPVQAYRVGDRLWATQFHPEPTPDDFAERMTFYRGHGYFDAERFAEVQQEVRSAPVTEATELLRRFAAFLASV